VSGRSLGGYLQGLDGTDQTPTPGGTVNTRTIAVIALILVVIVILAIWVF
jgi:hypothetical protein